MYSLLAVLGLHCCLGLSLVAQVRLTLCAGCSGHPAHDQHLTVRQAVQLLGTWASEAEVPSLYKHTLNLWCMEAFA